MHVNTNATATCCSSQLCAAVYSQLVSHPEPLGACRFRHECENLPGSCMSASPTWPSDFGMRRLVLTALSRGPS